MNEKVLEMFLESAVERHKVYTNKEMGLPKPWSEWPIYQRFFFCNVFRQYDKCSKWMIDKIVPLDRWDLLVLYRFISTMNTFERIENEGIVEDLPEIHQFLRDTHEDGMRMFSSCFIRNPRIPGGWTHTYNVPFILIESLNQMDFNPKDWNSLEMLTRFLSQFPGVGGFMGYEYSCDFEYTKDFNPNDKYTWANKGPGAQKGLSLVMHGNPRKKVSTGEWLERIQELFFHMQQRFAEVFPDEDLTMREVEHWLCEFQKFAKYGQLMNHGAKCKHRKYNGGS